MTDCASNISTSTSIHQESSGEIPPKHAWRKVSGDKNISGEVRRFVSPAATLIISTLGPLRGEIERHLADARAELESEHHFERSPEERELLRDLALGLVDLKDLLDWMVPEFQPYSGFGSWIEARMMLLGYDREILAAACNTTEATISRTLSGKTIPQKPLLDSLIRACVLEGETEEEARATLPHEILKHKERANVK